MEITPDLLLQAYRIGVFPMGERRDDPKLYWLDPRRRAVLPLDGFHLPHRLARTIRAGQWLGEDWVVLDGLKRGDTVIIDNLSRLRPGTAVQVKKAG